MTADLPLFDVTRIRHCGNAESRAAFDRISDKLPAARQAAFDYIKSCGPRGSTAQEYADSLGVGVNKVSGRFSELKMAELITKAGNRNRGGVYIAN